MSVPARAGLWAYCLAALPPAVFAAAWVIREQGGCDAMFSISISGGSCAHISRALGNWLIVVELGADALSLIASPVLVAIGNRRRLTQVDLQPTHCRRALRLPLLLQCGAARFPAFLTVMADLERAARRPSNPTPRPNGTARAPGSHGPGASTPPLVDRGLCPAAHPTLTHRRLSEDACRISGFRVIDDNPPVIGDFLPRAPLGRFAVQGADKEQTEGRHMPDAEIGPSGGWPAAPFPAMEAPC